MSTYKVIQDIEAEDHILGPLSLRQFIYAIIAVLCFYLCYLTYSKGAGFMIVLFLPPGLFCAFFAAPFGKDQPTEVWALAKIRFYFKPRKRIWDQSGMKELVSITVPKKVEVHRTDGLSQTEVRSRLSALANTIDSRGWVVKGVDLNLYVRPGLLPDGQSDRLVNSSNLPQEVSSVVVNASDDILDAQSNPIAQQFDQMINASSQAHHQKLVDMLNQDTSNGAVLPAPVQQNSMASESESWFLQQSTPLVPAAQHQQMPAQQVTTPTPEPMTADDTAISRQLRAQSAAQDVVYDHMKTIQPLGQPNSSMPPAVASTPAPAPKVPSATTSQLAANNDLNISTIARVANNQDLSSGEEVIIPLH